MAYGTVDDVETRSTSNDSMAQFAPEWDSTTQGGGSGLGGGSRSWLLLGLAAVAGAVVLAFATFTLMGGDDTATDVVPTDGELQAAVDVDPLAQSTSVDDGTTSDQGIDDAAAEPPVPLVVTADPTVPPTTAPPATEAPTTTTTVAETTTTVPATTAAEPPADPASETPVETTTAPDETTTTVAEVEPEPSTTTEAPAPPAEAPSSGEDAEFQQQVLQLTNANRAEAGCSALILDPTLNTVADGHSEDMAVRNYFSHDSPDGDGPGDRISDAGYQGRGWGENIAAGHRTAEAVVEGWMNSEGHRRNILNCDFNELGVGYAQGGSYGTYWTQVFGIRT